MAENVGDIEYVIKADTAQLLRADKQVRNVTDGMEGGFNRADKAASSLTSSFGSLSRVATSLMAILSVQQVAQYADAWTTLNNKLANALRPSEQLVDVTERVFNITQQTRGSLDATASLYARLERATREYGTSADDLAKLTTIINQGFVVSGATAQEAENAIIQLSQGLASGALRGEEFNSVNEQGNRLIVALADSMGVGIGQMRQMAAAGKLTTDVVVKGLLSQGVTIGNEFANTTTTISQALQVASNNITKFFGENSTVKTGTAIFNDAVISVSENIGALSAILTATAAVMGSRYVGALTMATAAKVKAAVAARNQSAVEMQAAQAVANKAAADLRAAAVAKERALDEIRLAEMMKQTAVSATNAAAAEQRLSVARVAATAAVANYNRALVASNAAQAAASSGAGLASRALRLIGGAGGAAMLAASAIIYFSQRAKEARDDANNLADSVNELSAKFQTMSHTELAATIGKLSQNLPTLSDAVADAQKEFNDAEYAVKNYNREIGRYGNTTRGREAAEALSGAQNRLAIATFELEKAQNRLSQTQNAINIGQATLNGTMRQGLPLLQREGEEAGITAGMMGKLGDMINFAAKAKEKFNSSSLMVERPKDVQDYLDKLQGQVTLQSELNDRKRAQLRAEQDIRKLGGSEADVRLARERAAAEYDAQQAQQKGKKETKDATSEASKAATAMQSNAQKIADYKQRAGLAATTTQELSREQAILRAEQSLNSSATKEQVAEIRKYAAAEWDAANAVKMRQQAEQGKKFAQQEIAAYKVMPDAQTGNSIDLLAQIDLEEQQKLAALAKYQAIDKENTQLYEDAKTAIQQQAANERINIARTEAQRQVDVVNTMLNGISQGFDGLATIIANSKGKNNTAFKALFAISKGFATAQAALNLQLAISNAMASGPFPWNMAAMAQVAAAGGSLISSIASVGYSGGRRYGGTVSAGNAYRINEDGRSEIFQTAGGQQAFIPNQSGKIIPADKAGGGGGVVQHITFEINTTGGIDDATMAKMAQMMKQVSLNTIRDQQRPNGLLRR
ncbi:tape measure protein [Enterobacter hormaechei]|uniref:tape measure protein n=1 Tax=Enterobacter TaxID=547 RepID=UPI000B4C5ECC|nr:tape measure protein [Enterobacter hormaechei]EKS6306787.1 tape measure protein [Enterobacter hormaechei]EKS6351216.1 tape measure protein [Enterobacter hormaechei]EKW1918352.1 tape measure protein [Enterobacter hormaechei]EKW8983990.1 tape measure protein [Enterobacter hormaechei]EKY4831169.1 tape measure protein [Enterobacter hormaechei]